MEALPNLEISMVHYLSSDKNPGRKKRSVPSRLTPRARAAPRQSETAIAAARATNDTKRKRR